MLAAADSVQRVQTEGDERPPLLPFVLAVGNSCGQDRALSVTEVEQLASVFNELKSQASEIHAANAPFFTEEPMRLVLHTSLAFEAERQSALIATALDFDLHVMRSLDQDHPSGTSLERQASGVLNLPRSDDAFGPATIIGLAIAAHSDLLIAICDGEPAIVELAANMSRPLIHLPSEGGPGVVRWGAFDPAFVTSPNDPAAIRTYSAEQISSVLRLLLAPPEQPRERQFIHKFQRERRRLWHLRIEYPLLLALSGISRLKRKHFHTDRLNAATDEEWAEYQEACFQAEAVSANTDLLRTWYEWTDSLAGHFAQSYRSGHVFNFVLGALAVLLGTGNLVLPQWSVLLESALFLVVLAIIANTIAGNRQQWHRRWLDYRQLAERLRPMRTLKLLAIAAPDPPGSAADPVARRWVEWYAARVWRAIGAPVGRIDTDRLPALTATIVDNEIMPQVAYHSSAAKQVVRLDRSLGIISFAAFILALCSSIVLLTGFAIAPAWVDAHYDWFTVLAAGLPAIGTAAVGIRVQGDHSGGAARSERSAVVLGQIGERLRSEHTSLKRAADLTEQSARAMLSDLDEWELLNQQHDLTIG